MVLWIPQSLAGTHFLRLGLFNKSWRETHLMLQGLHRSSLLTEALWAGSWHLLCSHRAPCSAGSSSTLPCPLSTLVDMLFTVLCFSSQVLGSGSEESWERCTGAFFNESNLKVSLEILFSFGNFYTSWSKSFFYTVHCFLLCAGQYWDGWDLWE